MQKDQLPANHDLTLNNNLFDEIHIFVILHIGFEHRLRIV